MDEYGRLLDAMDDITKPQRLCETQDVIRDHKIIGQQSVTLVHPPLLQQPEKAIASGIDGGKSKGSTAFERNPIDLDALYRFVPKLDPWRDETYPTPTSNTKPTPGGATASNTPDPSS